VTMYARNRSCPCARCRARGLTGGAILITLGVLFLLQEYLYIDLDRTWPVLLIVIGVMSYAARTASMKGHIQPWWMGGERPSSPPDQDNSGQAGGGPQVNL
jgi:hypothetical protein